MKLQVVWFKRLSWTGLIFVPSEQILDSHKRGRWMRVFFSDYTSSQPWWAFSPPIFPLYFRLYSLLSWFPPAPHLLQTASPEWRAPVVAFTKQLLTSHFPISGAHYTDYQYCQSEHPPCFQSRRPTLIWPGGLRWCKDPALPGDGTRWQQEEKALQLEKRAAREQATGTVTAALGSCDEVIPGKVIKSQIKKKIIQEVSDREGEQDGREVMN